MANRRHFLLVKSILHEGRYGLLRGRSTLQNIQWFPGHMAKARREMTAAMKAVDAVVELVDARLPLSSANPMLSDIIGARPRVMVLTRADMADRIQTERWLSHYRKLGMAAIAVDAKSGEGIKQIVPALEAAATLKRERDARRGIRPRPLRTMVVGIPNVGKSSLINRLAQRAVTKTGDRPGITKAQQWIRIGPVDLLDTPGVLWPKFDTAESGYILAMSGAIKPEILDTVDLAMHLVVFLARSYPQIVEDRLGLTPSSLATVDFQSTDDVGLVDGELSNLAIRRGMLMSAARPDVERLSEALVRETQTGKLGRITFEWCS